MKTKLFTLFVTLIATTALWASNVITYTATEKLRETTDMMSSGLHTNAFNIGITLHDFSNGVGTITFAGEITTIGGWAFDGCTKLTSVTIPNSVTTIGGWAFDGCTGLTSVTIPNSVTTIGNYAFQHVNNIMYSGTAIGSPWGAKCVNGYVDGPLVYSDASKTTLCGCSSTATGEIVIPNSVTTIGDWAFYFCSGLPSITIPNSVTTIGDYAFYGCSGLTSVTIPNSVTTIGDWAFASCGELTSINVDASNTHYCCVDGVLFNYAKDTLIQYPAANTRTEYTIPNSVTTIEDMAFYGCIGLTSIIIPNSVTTIGDCAFGVCISLTSVTIPNSVTTIGERAFSSCSGLTNISVSWTSSGQLPRMEDDVFDFIAVGAGPSAATLHVPAGTKSIYENADQWKDFGSIIEEGTDLEQVYHYSTETQYPYSKVLRNGQILLERNNTIYTLTGQKVK